MSRAALRAGGPAERANLLRQLRFTWRGVLHGIQLGGKAAEVVPGARLRGVTDS